MLRDEADDAAPPMLSFVRETAEGGGVDNETWILEAGGLVIEKKASIGFDCLSDWERLVYSLWVADYGMRNAGDLDTAKDVFSEFQSVALLAADLLSLPLTRQAFSLVEQELSERYFDLFEIICDEVRSAEPNTMPDTTT